MSMGDKPVVPPPAERKRSRTVIRIVIGLLLGVIIVVISVQLYQRYDSSKLDYDVVVTPTVIPADGTTSALVEIKITSRFGNQLNVQALPWAPRFEVTEGKDLIRVISLGDSLRYRLVPYFTSGRVVIRVVIPGAPGPIEGRLELTASLADRNHNGYPDAMDLGSESDRTAFRRWFTTVALAQLRHLDDGWHDRDCAGLARYCYREALKRHDATWMNSRKWLVTAAIPDVRKYNYPSVPLVGTRVFNAGERPDQARPHPATTDTPTIPVSTPAQSSSSRSRKGSPIAHFADFAEASRLKDNSIGFVSRSQADALPGDMLLYLNDTDSNWPYHLMIYLGNGMTVYHTGPDGDNPGIVKRLSLQQLAMHPNGRWHPVASNQYFLGFYRWKILE